MVKCPKCSFEQPEDIYCANCGVNMKTYKPTPESFLKSFINSWMGKIALITLVIVGILIYDWMKTKERPPPAYVSQNARAKSTKTAADFEPSAPPPAASRMCFASC